MKIDIHDIKFWMDAIRNSEDKERTLESFWDGQIKSKLWLIEALEKHKSIRNADCVIHGGWNGVLACMMFNSELGIKHITSIDIDPKCKEIASTMNKRYEMEGKFESVTADMCEYEYKREPYFVINTSCEHMSSNWFESAGSNQLIVMQTNDSEEFDGHINVCYTAEEMQKKYPLSKTHFVGSLKTPTYTRHMQIGYK